MWHFEQVIITPPSTSPTSSAASPPWPEPSSAGPRWCPVCDGACTAHGCLCTAAGCACSPAVAGRRIWNPWKDRKKEKGWLVFICFGNELSWLGYIQKSVQKCWILPHSLFHFINVKDMIMKEEGLLVNTVNIFYSTVAKLILFY